MIQQNMFQQSMAQQNMSQLNIAELNKTQQKAPAKLRVFPVVINGVINGVINSVTNRVIIRTMIGMILAVISLLSVNAYALANNTGLDQIEESYSGQFIIDDKPIHYTAKTLLSGLDHPWSVIELPDGSLLITERSGQLRLFSEGQLSKPVAGLPEVFVMGQAGLFDVVLHPDFANNQTLFLSYAHGTLESNTLRVVRAQLTGTAANESANSVLALTNTVPIYDVEPFKNTPVHYGGRMVVLPDNTLLITTGDGFDYREQAQQLTSDMGKVARISFDGGHPLNNPFVNQPKANNTIFTYGHRNPQGLIYDAKRQQIFMHEHGPAGGDEINWLVAGNNYGWPGITHGNDYSGAKISPYIEYKGMEQPLLHWTPSIAPSGMAVYYGEQFPEINGDFLVGALVDKEVRLVRTKSGKVSGANFIQSQQPLFEHLAMRIRDITLGNDGTIYLLTDSDNGKLIAINRSKR